MIPAGLAFIVVASSAPVEWYPVLFGIAGGGLIVHGVFDMIR